MNVIRSIARRYRRGVDGTARGDAKGGVLFKLDDLNTRARHGNEAAIRAACQTAYLGDDTALCRVLGRYKMFVDTRDIGLSTHLMLDGFWEMWLTELIVATVRRGMTVVDIGANLGYFTLLMADLVGPTGRAHAFEPNPNLTARLRQSIAVNGFHQQAFVHETALSDMEGAEVALLIPGGEPKNGYIVGPEATGDNVVHLQTRRLDGYPELARADVIKIDADTSEEAIWRGMAGTLANGRPMTIFLEFNPGRYSDPSGFLETIAAAGFSIQLLDLKRGPQSVTGAEILAGSQIEDRMLALRR